VFLGHFALGFGAKRIAPAVSLGTLFLASQLADLVWPNLVLTGVETLEVDPGNTAYTPLDFTSYPYSHSLVAAALGSVAFALIYRAVRRPGWGTVLALAGLVFSHWGLDLISHRPDLPLSIRGDTRVGFGLWNSVPATVLVETLLFAAGVGVYARTTKPRDRIGSIALGALVGFLAIVSAANALGPPPPGPMAVAWTAQAMWLIVAWGYWVDRHREARGIA
jgi:hypothetical protein